MNQKIVILTIIIGAALVGYTTGNVVAQEVKIGDTSGTPFISFEDALASGMYEIRLNDGTGEFQIWDITNSRNAFLVGSNGKVGVGDAPSTSQSFSIGCSTGTCNIQTLASDGSAFNTVKSIGGTGSATFKLSDVTTAGSLKFSITTQDDGSVCMGDPGLEQCMLKFVLKGGDKGKVKQADGTCIANC